jgi:hypothetical protein
MGCQLNARAYGAKIGATDLGAVLGAVGPDAELAATSALGRQSIWHLGGTSALDVLPWRHGS